MQFSEDEVAWALAELVGTRMPTVRRHRLFIALGLGEAISAIRISLDTAVLQRVSISPDLMAAVRSLVSVRRQAPEAAVLEGLLDRLEPSAG